MVKVAPGAIGSIVNSTYSVAATGISPVAGTPVTVPVIQSIPSVGILVLVSLLALSGLFLVKRR